MRSIASIGRIGSILLALGFALAIVSFIPPTVGPAGGQGQGAGGQLIPPHSYFLIGSRVYTPQNGALVTVSSNSSISVYLLGVNQSEISSLASSQSNISVLDAFVQSHPRVIQWKSPLMGNMSYSFFPRTVVNITAIVANPSSFNQALVSYISLQPIVSAGPTNRLVTGVALLIASGIVLVIPWLFRELRRID